MTLTQSSKHSDSAAALRFLAWAAAVSACLAAVALLPQAALAAQVDLKSIVDKIPNVDGTGTAADRAAKHTGPDPADAEKLCLEILKGGKDSIVGLVGLFVEPGKGEDYKARYLLHALATYVARPGAEKDRQMFCEAIAATLDGPAPKAVKGSVLQEFRYIGGKEAIAAAAKFLNDDELCEPAAMALLAIGGTADAFRPALAAAKGKNRVTIIQALGVLRDAQGLTDIKKAAGDSDRGVRLAAIDALASIGDPAAVDTLLAAADAKEPYDRIKATEAAFVLAKRLRESDKKADAERIYRRLWDTRTEREERHMRIGALEGLVAVRGDMGDVLAAMKTGDVQIRAAAVRLAKGAAGLDVTSKCVEAMQKASPPDRAALLAILGARADAAALPAVLGAVKDSDEQVRVAAMQAASSIGGPGAAEAIVAIVSASGGKDRDALDALAKMRGDEVNAIAGSTAMKASDPAVRAALVNVLATRRAEDQMPAVMAAAAEKDVAVRIAALNALAAMAGQQQLPTIVNILKDTKDKNERMAAEQALSAACDRQLGDACVKLLTAALGAAPPENAAAMIRVLGDAGNAKAMQMVVSYTKGASTDLKDAAIRTLAEWPTKEAAGPLLDVAQTSDNPTHQVLALRGIIRLASLKGVGADEQLKLLAGAMKAAKRPEEKRQVLAGLGSVQTVGALETAAACLDEVSLQAEAAAAVVEIAGKVAKQNPAAVRDALTKVLKVAKDNRVRKDAEKVLSGLKK